MTHLDKLVVDQCRCGRSHNDDFALDTVHDVDAVDALVLHWIVVDVPGRGGAVLVQPVATASIPRYLENGSRRMCLSEVQYLAAPDPCLEDLANANQLLERVGWGPSSREPHPAPVARSGSVLEQQLQVVQTTSPFHAEFSVSFRVPYRMTLASIYPLTCLSQETVYHPL